MNQAIDLDMIAPEQYILLGCSSQDNALHKWLVFDYFRFFKQPFGMCACDLKSCYDRIIHVAAALALRKIGVPPTRIKMMFKTVQTLVHQIRTAYRVSGSTYGGEDIPTHALPSQGTGQGNEAGPTI